MVSVVITEVMQFTILTLTALTIGAIAIVQVTPEMIAHSIPAGWMNPFFGWHLGLNWTAFSHGEQDDRAGWKQFLFDHHRTDVFQRRAGPASPARRRITICSASSPPAIPARPRS